MNATETNTLVQRALAGSYGLWVDTDFGDFDLFGADLALMWNNTAPGEGFVVLGVVTDEGRREL